MIWKYIVDAIALILHWFLLLVTRSPDFLPIPDTITAALDGFSGYFGYLLGIPGTSFRSTFYAAIFAQFAAGFTTWVLILFIRSIRTHATKNRPMPYADLPVTTQPIGRYTLQEMRDRYNAR